MYTDGIYMQYTHTFTREFKKKYYTAMFKRELEPLQNVQIIAVRLFLRTMLTVPSTPFDFVLFQSLFRVPKTHSFQSNVSFFFFSRAHAHPEF